MDERNLLRIAEFTPASLQSPNAWVGHLPFAAWLIKEVRPKMFVELGTHTGNSYFSFCQSIVESGIRCKCFAVDTWQGDEHAGWYNDEVFNTVNGYHQHHYAEFSRLLRMTFDDAVAYFSDQSIELLHIDGLHTYEAVRHDFDTWLPKLAPGAVVIFHDINVRERNFGVWKLWEELQSRYPNNLEFVHSHGLGVLQLNDAPNAKKLEWLYPDSPEKQKLINYFAALGSRQLERFELNELRQQVALLGKVVAEREAQIASLSEAATEREAQTPILTQAAADWEARIASLTQAVAERETQIASLTEGMVRRSEWALRLETELKNARSSLATITQSNSWKLTLPLREARRWFSSPTRQFRRYSRAILKFAKGIYQALPLSPQTIAKHRNALAKYLPRVLLASGAHPATVPVFDLPKPTLTEARLEEIHLVVSEKPVVSVIIPVYGKLAYTLRCLRSISVNPPKTDFEVIVVDDCSTDNSAEILKTIPGIRLLRNAQNLGFIRSCNAGANASLGEYLLFLNNDTEVQANWMEELLRTFYEFPGTGLAGSKLVYPDGRLQEAGGIIWQDGSAWNFGRLHDPSMPVYNYAREVDYCSGASIMVPKALFNELGGFDEHYLPAYCEDADLALKIRDKGYRVIYQPLSMVIHHEGITSGTDTSKGTKSFQVENTRKLHSRWKDRLRTHQLPGIDVDAAKDRRASLRVLIIDHCTPTPNQDSGSIDAYNLMLLLREMDFQVTFIPEDNFMYMPDYTAAMQRVGVEVLYAPYVTNVEQHLKDSGSRYDLVFLFRPLVAERHMTAVRKLCPKAKVIFHTVDLHFLRMMREAELYFIDSKKKAADSMRQRELSLIKAADISTVLSTRELTELTQYVPKEKVRLLPYSRNIRGATKGYADRHDIVFIGGFQHPPNVDAVQYFAKEVMPLLRKRLPGVRFYVVGSNPPANILALSAEDIVLLGFVEQLEPLLDKMRVSVAPLRYGAGIKGKIGTAMAVGLPVVATSLAAEGMSLTDGENILVADGTEAFVDAITRIYQDEALWTHISQRGLTFADKAWGAEAAWGTLAGILADLGIGARRGGYPLSLYSEFKRVEAEPEKTPFLKPIASITSRKELEQLAQGESIKQIAAIETRLLSGANSEAFAVKGFCVPCEKKVSFLVDMESGGRRHETGWTPNWRERLECPSCRMNNRQRLIATLVKQMLSARQGQQVYFMEQVTPIYHWASARFREHSLTGSEYLGYEYEGGTSVRGIRHEDVENLSFGDEYFDLIVSNDVFEHVPNPAKAFAECARVLKRGGVMLATIPFHNSSDLSVTRARIKSGQLEHILSPAYHGNPISANGSLVFTDFGWDLLDVIKEAGFFDVCMDVYASSELGHLGGGQPVFRASKMPPA